MAHDVLIVDDEADIRAALSGILEDEGYTVRTAAGVVQAQSAMVSRRPSLVILDIWLDGSDRDGMAFLDQIVLEQPDVPVLMISGHGTIETAVASIKRGAWDFVEKPFRSDRLLLVVERAIESARLRREIQELRQRSGDDEELVGQSQAACQLRRAIERVAPTNSRVLITGPAGAGKEIVARRLHRLSRRAERPLVVINAAAMAPDRFEIELFGAERGVLGTNAPRTTGTLERAHGGTLLLDNVADMPLQTQGKILRALQDQTFYRMGGNTPVSVDVRVLATTNRDLTVEIERGRFREDLYYRLNVVPLRVPPLAERREDIAALTSYFIERAGSRHGLPTRAVAEEAMVTLQSADWQGNVRQLKNVVDWLLIMAPTGADGSITADMLPPEIAEGTPLKVGEGGGEEFLTMSLRDARLLFERHYLQAQLVRFGGNVSRTAGFVGMERSALHRKLKSLRVDDEAGETERD